MSAASKRNFGIIACHARKSLNDNSQPHSKSGNSAHDKVNWIDLAVPGVRVIRPRSSRLRIIWWTEGGVTPKYCCISASAGGTRWILV